MSERDPLDSFGFWSVFLFVGFLVLFVVGCVGWAFVTVFTSTGPCPWLP